MGKISINIKKFFYFLIVLLVSFPLYLTYIDGSIRFDNTPANPLGAPSIQTGFFIIIIYLFFFFPRKVTSSYLYLLIYLIIFYNLKFLFGFDFYTQQIVVTFQILVVISFIQTDFFKKFQNELKAFPIIIFLVVLSDFTYNFLSFGIIKKGVTFEATQFLNTNIHIYHYYDYWPGVVMISALYLINQNITLNINTKKRGFNIILAILLLTWVIFVSISRIFGGLSIFILISLFFPFLKKTFMNVKLKSVFIFLSIFLCLIYLLFFFFPFHLSFKDFSLQIRLWHWYNFLSKGGVLDFLFPIDISHRKNIFHNVAGSLHSEHLEILSEVGIFPLIFIYIIIYNAIIKSSLHRLIKFFLIIIVLLQGLIQVSLLQTTFLIPLLILLNSPSANNTRIKK